MCTAVLLATGGVCCGRLVVDEWVCVFAFCGRDFKIFTFQ